MDLELLYNQRENVSDRQLQINDRQYITLYYVKSKLGKQENFIACLLFFTWYTDTANYNYDLDLQGHFALRKRFLYVIKKSRIFAIMNSFLFFYLLIG